MIPFKQTPHGVTFVVKVQPRARRNGISGTVGNVLKLAVTAPRLEGRANQGIVEFLAEFFDIPRSSVTIASGHTSRLKLICISRVSVEYLQRRLGSVNTP